MCFSSSSENVKILIDSMMDAATRFQVTHVLRDHDGMQFDGTMQAWIIWSGAPRILTVDLHPSHAARYFVDQLGAQRFGSVGGCR